MVYKGGIHIESELAKYREKSRKWDKALALRIERAKIKKRIRQIAQEESKLFGVKEDEKAT